MNGPRAPTQKEFGTVLRFLDESLRPKSGWSVTSEYPSAFSNSNIHNVRFIQEGPDVVSHAVLRPMLVKSPIGFFKVGAIGSVVTNEKYRRQGYSQKIIEECLKLADEHTCDFAILWTNLFDFYKKMGFELAGTELSFKIAEELKVPSEGLRFLCSNKIDPAAIYRLFSQHSIATIRTIEEIRKYLEIPNSRVYTAWDSLGNLQAYAVEGKGADLDGYVHEWGGGVSKVLPLLNYVIAHQKRPITVIAPRHAENFVRQLGEMGISAHEGFLGMVKIVNPKGIFSKVNRHARIDLGIEEFIFTKEKDDYVFGLRANPYSTKSDADLIKLIFGPHSPNFFQSFDPATRAVLEKIFPLRMWLWGWDSI